jgi:hypothetical protein
VREKRPTKWEDFERRKKNQMDSVNFSDARRFEGKKKTWLSMSFHFNDLKIVTRKNINANSRSNFTNIIPVSELITFFIWWSCLEY